MVCSVFTKLLQSMLFYIVCRVGNNTMCAWHVCGGALILKCVRIGVQHTWHYFGTYSVSTSMYWSVLILIAVPVCTRYVLVHTDSEQVRTKCPVPVMHVTIPDGATVIARWSQSGILTTWHKRAQTCLYHVCTVYIPCYSTAADRHGMYNIWKS